MGEGAGEGAEDRLARHTGIRRPRPLGTKKAEGERLEVGRKAAEREGRPDCGGRGSGGSMEGRIGVEGPRTGRKKPCPLAILIIASSSDTLASCGHQRGEKDKGVRGLRHGRRKGPEEGTEGGKLRWISMTLDCMDSLCWARKQALVRLWYLDRVVSDGAVALLDVPVTNTRLDISRRQLQTQRYHVCTSGLDNPTPPIPPPNSPSIRHANVMSDLPSSVLASSLRDRFQG